MLAVFAFAPGRRDPGKRDIDGTPWHPTVTATWVTTPRPHPNVAPTRDVNFVPTQKPYGGWHMMTATPNGSGTPTLYSYP
jgi:hypothetical protein